jgi:hypothetical protein
MKKLFGHLVDLKIKQYISGEFRVKGSRDLMLLTICCILLSTHYQLDWK